MSVVSIDKKNYKLFFVFFAFLIVTYSTYKLHGSPEIGIDDANIFFTYASNLASGKGIIYGNNPEHVEGFTSMLWMLACSVFFKIKLIEFNIIFFNIFLMTLTNLLFLKLIDYYASKNNRKPLVYQVAYLILIISNPGYITWMTITLMDTCLWGLIIGAMTYAILCPPGSGRKKWIVYAIPFVLAPLSRPEGILIAPLFLLLLWLSASSRGSGNANRFCFYTFVAYTISVFSITFFRIYYFGYPFPNTYYAKVSPSLAYNLSTGLDYLNNYILNGIVPGFLVLFCFLVLIVYLGYFIDIVRLREQARISIGSNADPLFLTALIAGILLFIPVAVGGDHFLMFRFYQPVYPVLCLMVMIFCLQKNLIEFEMSGSLIKPLSFFIAFSIALFIYQSGHSWASILKNGSLIEHEFRFAESSFNEGKNLDLLFEDLHSYPSVGIILAGGFARTYSGKIIDLMGLNNLTIAHSQGDRIGIKNHAAFEKNIFFTIEPDIMLLSPTDGFATQALRNLFEDERFVSRWRYGVLKNKISGKSKRILIKNEYLKTITNKFEFEDTFRYISNKWQQVRLPDSTLKLIRIKIKDTIVDQKKLFLRIVIDNQSNQLIPAFSETNNLIRLVWRFTDGSGKPLTDGWPSNRRNLDADILAKEKLLMNLQIDTPEKPGSYYVEVTVVQEGIAWLHDLGMPVQRSKLIEILP
jgi:hypothetical protein